ncbi:MAG: hypothetical protein MJ058_02760 [Akkermansia sp.]|nr:hypothetical protein [Akkermansia sp.]
MKAIEKRRRSAAAKARPRKGRSVAVKIVKKNNGKKLIIASDWMHLTRPDVDLVVGQINNPPAPSAGLKSVEPLYSSILQLD